MEVLKSTYELEELVTLKTDPYKNMRIITGITFHIGGGITYRLAFGDTESWHFEIEIESYDPVALNLERLTSNN